MAKYKVLMTDCIFPDQDIEREILSEIDAELVVATSTDVETLIREGKDCDAIITVYAEVGEEFINALEKCKLIIKTGIGVNNIDVNAATKKGIMVANVPDYCISEVADHAMALFLCGIRKVEIMDRGVKSGVWNFNSAKPIPRLAGKVFGLFGFGNIAQCVAQRAKAFDMEVVAYDPYIPEEIFRKAGVKRIGELDTLFRTSDFLSLHVPLNPETRHVVNLDSIGKMKRTAYIVNTSRGPLIKEDDLLVALKKGLLAGAALDVLENEPPEAGNELLSLPNILITPHAAFYSEGSSTELREKSTQDVVRTLTEGAPKNWLNKNA